jgi:CO/xanthine dehydrogenase FAD-binding subunit
MPFIAHPAIRNRGTIGGSLAHADPAAELPAVMLALDARFGIRGTAGQRLVNGETFFAGLFATDVQPGELLTDITIPKRPSRTGFGFQEISRRHGDFALVGVAASVTVDQKGTCTAARIALFSVGDRPMLARHAAAALVGQLQSPEAIRAAADAAASQDIDPSSDIHASAKYRRQLANVLTRRVLTTAFSRITST